MASLLLGLPFRFCSIILTLLASVTSVQFAGALTEEEQASSHSLLRDIDSRQLVVRISEMAGVY